MQQISTHNGWLRTCSHARGAWWVCFLLVVFGLLGCKVPVFVAFVGSATKHSNKDSCDFYCCRSVLARLDWCVFRTIVHVDVCLLWRASENNVVCASLLIQNIYECYLTARRFLWLDVCKGIGCHLKIYLETRSCLMTFFATFIWNDWCFTRATKPLETYTGSRQRVGAIVLGCRLRLKNFLTAA